MLNICHIISGDLWAGAEVMAYHLIKGLRSYSNCDLCAIVLNNGRLSEEIKKIGIRTFVVDEKKLSFLEILLAVHKILRKNPSNIIHSHRYKENILAYVASRFIPGIKLISTQHGMPEIHEGKRNVKQPLISLSNFFMLSHCFHQVVGVSQDIENAFIKKYGFKEERVSCIHNGIEVPKTLQERGNTGKVTIGSSGRLFPIKDYPLMVEIAKIVSKKSKNVRFILAGDGPERGKLQSLIEEYGLQQSFTLIGHTEDMDYFYKDLDLYINTSIHEGIPMSILEAMSYGLPVIAPEVGGISEIISDGVEGYLISSRDPEDFAERCIRVFENRQLRAKMSNAARQKVIKEFSMERMAEQYYKLYVKIAKNTASYHQ
jgi:L-malate glycosyltransferase